MITEYFFTFFSTEMTGNGSYLEKLFFSIIMSWLLIMFLFPIILSGFISLFVAIPVAILEKNQLSFTYNYINDLVLCFFKINDFVSIIFLICLGIVYFYKEYQKNNPAPKKNKNRISYPRPKRNKKKRK